MKIGMNELATNPSWRGALVDWVLQVKSGNKNPTSKLMGNSIELDPTTAAQLGIDYNTRVRQMGGSLKGAALNLEFNRQHSHEKSKEYQAALMMLVHSMFLREVMMMNRMLYEKLMKAIEDYVKGDDSGERLNLATAVRLRLEEEQKLLDEYVAMKAAINHDSSDFDVRFIKAMEQNEIWLAAADRSDDEWIDRVLPPPTTEAARAFRVRHERNIEDTKKLRRECAQVTTGNRLIAEDNVKNAKTPEQKAKAETALEEAKRQEEETKLRAKRSAPKELEKQVIANLAKAGHEPSKIYMQNLDDRKLTAEYDALTADQKAKFDETNPNAIKEAKARLEDKERQSQVQDVVGRMGAGKVINEEFGLKNAVTYRKKFLLVNETPVKNATVAKAKPENLQNGSELWSARQKDIKAKADQKEKAQLIKATLYTLNVAEEKSRSTNVGNPAVDNHLMSIYNVMDDKTLTQDQVLDKLQEKLDSMKKDDDVPLALQNAAKICSTNISQFTNKAATEKNLEAPTRDTKSTAKTTQLEKNKLIQRIHQTLDVAEKQSRNGANIENPTVANYMESIYKVVDNEEFSLDQVLEKLQVELNNMKDDAAVPDTLRNAAEKCATNISAFTNQTSVSAEATNEARNGRRDVIKELDLQNATQSEPKPTKTEYLASEEKMDELKSAIDLFDQVAMDKKISPEQHNQLLELKTSLMNYCDDQTSSNAEALKEMHNKIDWGAIDFNEKTGEIRSLIEFDNFLDNIGKNIDQNQDLDAAQPASKSM